MKNQYKSIQCNNTEISKRNKLVVFGFASFNGSDFITASVDMRWVFLFCFLRRRKIFERHWKSGTPNSSRFLLTKKTTFLSITTPIAQDKDSEMVLHVRSLEALTMDMSSRTLCIRAKTQLRQSSVRERSCTSPGFCE